MMDCIEVLIDDHGSMKRGLKKILYAIFKQPAAERLTDPLAEQNAVTEFKGDNLQVCYKGSLHVTPVTTEYV